MESIKFENMGTDEGIREILGFLHHRISQQEKDIALLNRRVAELIQKSKFSDQSTIQAFMEASNCRLDSFSASIQSLTDQMIKFTVPSQLNFFNSSNKSKDIINEFKNEIRDDISQINIEIESLKNQMIIFNVEKEKIMNSYNHLEKNIKNLNEQENIKSKTLKKTKSKRKKIDTVSIFDIKPSQNSTKQHHQTSLDKQQIDSLTNEINQIKNKLSAQNEISNHKFINVNEKIDGIERKLEFALNADNIIQYLNDPNKRIEQEIENISDKIFSNQKSLNDKKSIESNDSLESLPISDFDFKNNINRKNSLGSITYSDKNNQVSKQKSFAATTKLNYSSKNGSPSKISQNATPRKTTAHYTLINGDCLKRPGSQMTPKRSAYKTGQQKYPL